MTDLSHDDVVKELCIPLAEALWGIYHGDLGSAHLIFPHNGTSRRVSEQESRILLCQILERAQRFYSVETPTIANYMQKGTHERHARVDVTIHAHANDDPEGRILNVELKEKVTPPFNFRKDFEKLAKEGVRGLWFHTLKDADHRTFETLASRMRESWDDLNGESIVPTREITFAICVLKPRTLYTASRPPDDGTEPHVPGVFDPNSPKWTLYPGDVKGVLGG